MCALRDRTARPPECLGCVTAFRTRGSIPCAAMRLSLHEKRRDHFRHAFCLFNCLTNTPLRAAASLFPIVSRDGPPCKIKRSKPSHAKTSCRRRGPEGEAGGTHTVRRVLPPIKRPLFFGAPPHFFGQGPKKWGGKTPLFINN